MKVKITPTNEAAVEKLKGVVEKNKKVLFKLLRLGSRFVKASEDPYTVYYVSKYYSKFAVNSVMGKQLKDPLTVAVYQTLAEFKIEKKDAEVVLVD